MKQELLKKEEMWRDFLKALFKNVIPPPAQKTAPFGYSLLHQIGASSYFTELLNFCKWELPLSLNHRMGCWNLGTAIFKTNLIVLSFVSQMGKSSSALSVKFRVVIPQWGVNTIWKAAWWFCSSIPFLTQFPLSHWTNSQGQHCQATGKYSPHARHHPCLWDSLLHKHPWLGIGAFRFGICICIKSDMLTEGLAHWVWTLNPQGPLD